MKAKYIYEKLNGEISFPACPTKVKSKEDLQRWFEHTDQFYDEKGTDDRSHLLSVLPQQFIKEQTDTEIIIMFPRCRYSASALFTGNECYRIAL